MRPEVEICAVGTPEFDALCALIAARKSAGQRIVTTNGCFDGLHGGHTSSLDLARSCGDVLIVGVNDDESVRTLKGQGRPQHAVAHRAAALAALRCVDAVVVFGGLYPDAFLEGIKPHLHCKSADYKAEQLPEGPLLKRLGAQIRILPMVPRVSSSGASSADGPRTTADEVLIDILDAASALRRTAYSVAGRIDALGREMAKALTAGRRVYVCGNGGSAAEAQHFAAELVGRFAHDRPGFPAMALTADAAATTAIANDYGFEQVFARQVAAFGLPGDFLFAISTSGKSPNVLRAAEAARDAKMRVIAITGPEVSPLTGLADVVLPVDDSRVSHIQLGHRAILHALCRRLDGELGA